MTPTDAELLDFEASWPLPGAAKDSTVVAVLGMPPTLYHQRLGALLDDPKALAYNPLLIKRLRRLRATRRGATNSA